jgi:hypothetical protein
MTGEPLYRKASTGALQLLAIGGSHFALPDAYDNRPSWDDTVGIQVAASPPQPVPEPATVALVVAALLAMTGLSTRSRRGA